MSSDPIDALIDDTAKEMTAGSPSIALREHLRARLTPAPRAWWQVPMWQPVLGAAVLIAIAFVLLWRSPAVPGGPAPVRFEPPLAPEVVQAIDEPAIERVAVAPRAPVARAVRLPVLPDDINVEPLDFTPIPQSSLAAIERIAVLAPLQVEQLAIAELLSE